MAHPYFDELREQENLQMPNGNSYIDVFSFSKYEKDSIGKELCNIIIPSWYNSLQKS